MLQNIEVTPILVLMDIILQTYLEIVDKLALLKGDKNCEMVNIFQNMCSEGMGIHKNLIQMDKTKTIFYKTSKLPHFWYWCS